MSDAPASTCCAGCPDRRCRGCQCARLGLVACEGGLRAKLAYWRGRRAPGRVQPGALKLTPAGIEGGPQTGHHLEHWTGRVDATVESAVTYRYPGVRPPSLDPPGGDHV